MLSIFLWILPVAAHAQVMLHHTDGSGWSQSGIALCSGTTAVRNFQAYRYVPGQFQGYFRFNWTLYRDQQEVGFFSSIWDLRGNNFAQNYTFQNTFFNVNLQSGTYTVRLEIEQRTGFPFHHWDSVFDGTSNGITVTPFTSTYSFLIKDRNGNFVPPNTNKSPIEVSLSGGIIMDASATTCEASYLLVIEESDLSWGRPWIDQHYGNEWGHWFSGSAPNNIDLNLLTMTASPSETTMGHYFPLTGGTFVGGSYGAYVGKDRYYRVSLQASPAPWNPLYALIHVNW